MPEKNIRFSVADAAKNLRAATWKVWSPNQKSDVYIACRELNGALKLSLHQSNQWHIAYDKNFFESKVPKGATKDSDRFIYKWLKPNELGAGITLALRIVTPWTAVGTEFIKKSKLKLIQPPDNGKAVEIGILISEKAIQASDWPAKNSMNSKLVGTYSLPDNKRVWVISWGCECPDFSSLPTEFNFFKGVKKSDIADTFRAIVFGDNQDGSKVLYDLLGRKA